MTENNATDVPSNPYSLLAERLNAENRKFRARRKQYTQLNMKGMIVSIAVMLIFFFLLGTDHFQENTQDQYYLLPIILVSFGLVFLFSHKASKVMPKLHERWGMASYKAYEEITTDSSSEGYKRKASKRLFALTKWIKSVWDIDYYKVYGLGFLLSPTVKFTDVIERMALQMTQNDSKTTEEAKDNLLILTDFFFHPSEEGCNQIMNRKIVLPISTTLTSKYDIKRQAIDSPLLKRLKIAGIFGAGAIATFFISMNILGIGKDTAYAVSAAVALSFFVYDFKKK